jgi:uncharacterized repeat protein (TIGR03803 family)
LRNGLYNDKYPTMQKTFLGRIVRNCSAVCVALSSLGASVAAAQTYSPVMYFFGTGPAGKLAFTDDGNLAGAATESQFSGTSYGLYYKVNPNAAGIATIYEYGRLGVFTGAGPRAGLLRSTDGSFYGTTSYNYVDTLRGGQFGTGTIFRMNQDGSGYTKLYEFEPLVRNDTTQYLENMSGAIPQAGLIEADDNGVRTLFGTTFQGGDNGVGTVFKIRADGTGFTTLHHFGLIDKVPLTDANGANVLDENGNVILVLKTNIDGGDNYKNDDGANLDRSLVLGDDGRLYGVVTKGGPEGTGVIFAVTKDGVFTILHAFEEPPDFPPDDPATTTVNEALFPRENAQGGYPRGALVRGPNNLLYGTTSAYGPHGYGTVFSISTTTPATFTVLRAFTGAETLPPPEGNGGDTPGATPAGDMIIGSDGMLIGTFATNGFRDDAKTILGAGGIFKLSLDGLTYSTPFVFPNPQVDATNAYWHGYSPGTGVIQDADGNLYGIASGGGAAGSGVLFKFGTPTNRDPLGIPPPYDDGRGSMSWWMLGALLTLAGWRIAARRSGQRTAA